MHQTCCHDFISTAKNDMRTQSNFQDRDGIHFGISWLDRWGIKPPYVPALSLHVAQAASYSPKSSETCIKIGGVRCLGARILQNGV